MANAWHNRRADFGPGTFCSDADLGLFDARSIYACRLGSGVSVKLSPTGIPLEHADEMRSVPGVKDNEFAPLVVEQTKFADDFVGANERANAARQDNCVFIGLIPRKRSGGSKPLFDFRFVEETRDEAISRLKSTRSCLVPDHFAREGNFKIGDKFHRDSARFRPATTLEYEIAGVVSMDGLALAQQERSARPQRRPFVGTHVY